MSKELKALEKVFNYNDFYEVKSYNKIDLKKSFKKEYNTIKQALTPPTDQEVCEALSEWFKNKEIKYENGDFYYQPMITKPKQYISIKRKLAFSEKIVYTIETQLPPHLITMIGRFYEGKVMK